MRAWMIRVLLALLTWLGYEPPQPEPALVPTPLPERAGSLDAYAVTVVKWIEAKGLPAAADQYKRALAYNRLVKAYPEARRRDVSWAIESAVRAVKP
jgi:hypothetical protein